ncbi:MspA family porin [Mycobacterium kyogaense]|uniref:MspA family porin n=1 Tax=Mycobacterium kyogaense TaxID=2212479 RepID=UPI001F08BCEC|nr:MspA family porin [Mycobacterium kyogaense]
MPTDAAATLGRWTASSSPSRHGRSHISQNSHSIARALTVTATAMVAAALLPDTGIASAEPVALPDVSRHGETADGWQLSLSMTRIAINAVPNMAATPFTGEGFASARVEVNIDDEGRMPVNSGSVVVGVQLGCQVKLDEGMDLGIGNQLDVVADDPFLNVTPSIGVDLRPGYIRTVGLGAKRLKGRTGIVSVEDAHVQIDGCGGPVSVRLFASAHISTDTSDDSVNVYGDIVRL